MRQTVGEKQTFLVQAKSYKTIWGAVWVAMSCLDGLEKIDRLQGENVH